MNETRITYKDLTEMTLGLEHDLERFDSGVEDEDLCKAQLIEAARGILAMCDQFDKDQQNVMMGINTRTIRRTAQHILSKFEKST